MYGISTFHTLIKKKYNVVCILDESKLLQSQTILGINVKHPSILLNKSKDSLSTVVVIVSNQSKNTFNSIAHTLKKYGLSKRQIIHNVFG